MGPACHSGDESALHESLRQEDADAGRQHAEQLLERDPFNVPSRVAMAKILATEGHRDEARRTLSEALETDPKNTSARLEAFRLARNAGAALRKWRNLPEDSCARLEKVYFNYAAGLHGQDRLKLVDSGAPLSRGPQVLLRSTGLAQAGEYERLHKFLTPERVVGAYGTVADGRKSGYRRFWAVQMALLVGHVYGVSWADRWEELAREADRDHRRVRSLSTMFAAMRRRGREKIREDVLVDVFSSKKE